jgi:hypothetical protein
MQPPAGSGRPNLVAAIIGRPPRPDSFAISAYFRFVCYNKAADVSAEPVAGEGGRMQAPRVQAPRVGPAALLVLLATVLALVVPAAAGAERCGRRSRC